jgi:GT2 family glycosyltransferase
LESIISETKIIDYEIIVVDNDSQDGSEEMVKLNFPNVLFIQSGDNIGFGPANNLGIRIARGKYVFLLNSDTILLNDAIGILSSFLDNNPDTAICGGNLFNSDLKQTISYSQFMPGFINDIDDFFGGVFSKILFGKNLYFNNTNEVVFIKGYISGADMMIRKKVLDEVGLFDPDFFMYYEETELTWRIKKAGYKIASVPDAKIIHLEGSSELIKEKTLRRMIKSKYIYFKKINLSGYIIITFLISVLISCSRILYFNLVNSKDKCNKWKNLFKINLQEYKHYKSLRN